jgi:Ion channel/Pentapeptide repeats (8 copies)
MVGFLKRRYARYWEKYQKNVPTAHEIEEIGVTLRSELRKRGIPVPEPPSDGCQHQYIFGTQFCGRSRLSGGNLCFWHLRDEKKYDHEVLSGYFGRDVSLKRAIEDEIKAGRCLGGAYLKNAALAGSWLVERGVDLSGADLRGANLSGAHLSYASLRNANLAFATLESAHLGDVDLSGCMFRGATLFNAKFRNNDFTQVTGLEKSSFRDSHGNIVAKYRMLEDYPEQTEPMYRALVAYFSSHGALDDASWAAYRYRVMHHRILRKKLTFTSNVIDAAVMQSFSGQVTDVRALAEVGFASWMSILLEFAKSCLYRGVFGYGEKPLRVALVSGTVILSYAGVYAWFGALKEKGFYTALYFSVVTFTTLGYGDLQPASGFRLVAASEALVGLLLSGLFLFTLSRRAVGRS